MVHSNAYTLLCADDDKDSDSEPDDDQDKDFGSAKRKAKGKGRVRNLTNSMSPVMMAAELRKVYLK